MWDLVFTGDLVTGYKRDDVIINLAKLLGKAPDSIRNDLFTGDQVRLQRVTSEREARQWRRHFADAGALLMILPADTETADGLPLTGLDPGSRNIEEPTMASVFARVPAIRRRNQAFIFLALSVLTGVVIAILVATFFQ